MKTRLFSAAVMGLGLLIGSAGLASATTWDMSAVNSTGNSLGNVKSFNSSGAIVDVAGWTSNGGGNFTASAVNEYSGLGLGVCNSGEYPSCSSPQHAIDNDGYNDFILVMFDSDMTISSFNVSSFGYDTDLTYYVGHSNAFTTGTWNISSLSPSTLGFTAIGSAGGTSSRTVNVNQVGNFILIGGALPNPDYNKDYFKLKSITATPLTIVPEPATWGLMIMGFAGLASLYRRRTVRA